MCYTTPILLELLLAPLGTVFLLYAFQIVRADVRIFRDARRKKYFLDDTIKRSFNKLSSGQPDNGLVDLLSCQISILSKAEQSQIMAAAAVISDHLSVTFARSVPLEYTIADCSSFSEQYPPENIQNNKPSDQGSRWSSETNAPPQYLLLRLASPALLRRVTFGKYEKPHVCNPKRLRVSAGLSPTAMYNLATCQLANDSTPESFCLSLQLRGREIPCLYVRLEPLITWGGTFNFSIWFVQLEGITDPVSVERGLQWLRDFREQESVRLCLKHLRQNDLTDAFRSLSSQTGVRLEHPLLTELYDCLVERGDFNRSEELIQLACESHLFDQYASLQACKAVWQPIGPAADSQTGQVHKPGMRGGHQMALDHLARRIYLLGGWDGCRDLADFWAYDIDANRWRCLSADTSADGGPSPRSCHKICFDYERKRLYTLGRYVDSSLRDCPEAMRSDFYVWDAESGAWLLICEDTASQQGGPCLLFDHQMCIHVAQQVIYVFGGRELHRSDSALGGAAGGGGTGGVGSEGLWLSYNQHLQQYQLQQQQQQPPPVLSSTSQMRRLLPAHTYSGLHSYHIATDTWTLLRCDSRMLAPRMGHSMLLHPTADCLYVLAGQRVKEQLTDFVRYDMSSGRAVCLADHACKPSGCGLTQRATLDPELNEIYVLTGPGPHRERVAASDQQLHLQQHQQHSLWVYSIRRDRWACVYRPQQQQSLQRQQQLVPAPRYAHQLLYDPAAKVHYLFGGKTGAQHHQLPHQQLLPERGQSVMGGYGGSGGRLDDFWSLRLVRDTPETLARRCRLLLRRQLCLELLASGQLAQALGHLRQRVAGLADPASPTDAQLLGRLAQRLVRGSGSCGDADACAESDSDSDSDADVGEAGIGCCSSDRADVAADAAARRLLRTTGGRPRGGGSSSGTAPRDQRRRLFNRLSHLFPEAEAQPRARLPDLLACPCSGEAGGCTADSSVSL